MSAAFLTWLHTYHHHCGPKVFGVQVGNFPSWQALAGAIWVHNSIAHGSGGLSRMWKRIEATKAKGLGVSLIDGAFTSAMNPLPLALMPAVPSSKNLMTSPGL